MKVIILSDSHAHMGFLKKAAELIKKHKYDAIIHLGDLVSDAEFLQRETGIPLYSVAGNCDVLSSARREIVFRAGAFKVMLVHGDRQHVKSGLLNLRYAAEQAGCGYAFFGHTHVQTMKEADGMTFVNPGALNCGWYAEAEDTDAGLEITLDNLGE